MNAPDLESRPILAPRVRLQADQVSGQPVLLYPEGLLELNETGHAIVRRCDGETPLRQIVAQLAEEYEVPAEELTADVLDYLTDLTRRNLIVFRP
ncbi:MAG: pyrroloquinoline quinone biosynthesis protein [Chthoniobacter sp.]|jgi:coenzyme PQQ biosynthesis protein PqqD|nr:pyrroloquinoline quinone biosynthesis protein [Chthoniobacter sp.]